MPIHDADVFAAPGSSVWNAVDGGRRVGGKVGAVHRLQEEMLEIQRLETLRRRFCLDLWIHQLELVADDGDLLHGELVVGQVVHGELGIKVRAVGRHEQAVRTIGQRLAAARLAHGHLSTPGHGFTRETSPPTAVFPGAAGRRPPR